MDLGAAGSLGFPAHGVVLVSRKRTARDDLNVLILHEPQAGGASETRRANSRVKK